MVAWGYEFYLLVLKVSLTIKFVSPGGHVISSTSQYFLGTRYFREGGGGATFRDSLLLKVRNF